MCKACRETPDGEGVRCNRPDGEFTPVEADQRNRTRNLQGARNALAAGDPQVAANAMAHAVAAQQRLDGGPQVPVGAMQTTTAPHRDFKVSPSQVQAALGRLNVINANRAKRGEAPLDITTSKTYTPIGSDGVMAYEQVHVRVIGASQDELATVSIGNISDVPERRVRTSAVLEAAVTATRLNGGVYAKRGEPDGIPDQVDAFIADEPNGARRQQLAATKEDQRRATAVRMWVRSQQPTTEYMANLRNSVSGEYMNPREAGIAAGAVAGFQRYQANINRASSGSPATSASTSRWLNKKGDKVIVTGHVEKVVKVPYRDRVQPHFLHIIRTPEGHLVRWMASSEQGVREGDDITLRGTVKDHSMFNGEKQTEMFYCDRQIHPRQASAQSA